MADGSRLSRCCSWRRLKSRSGAGSIGRRPEGRGNQRRLQSRSRAGTIGRRPAGRGSRLSRCCSRRRLQPRSRAGLIGRRPVGRGRRSVGRRWARAIDFPWIGEIGHEESRRMGHTSGAADGKQIGACSTRGRLDLSIAGASDG